MLSLTGLIRCIFLEKELKLVAKMQGAWRWGSGENRSKIVN
jgi:hypothetical protein